MIQLFYRKIRNRKQKQRSRLYRYANRTITILTIIYGLLLFFPNPLFSHTARVGQFTFHSDRPIPAEIEVVVERATAKLSASPLYSTSDSFDVYIVADRWRRTLLNPRSPKAFGVNMILTGNIVLNRCDITNDDCTNDMPEFNRRSMHSVLAHEAMHQVLANNLGLLAYLRLPTWKNEGYCEYVADSPSFDAIRGQELVRSGKSHSSPAFRYLTYLFAVRSCLDDQGLQPKQFLSRPLDFEATLDSYVHELHGG